MRGLSSSSSTSTGARRRFSTYDLRGSGFSAYCFRGSDLVAEVLIAVAVDFSLQGILAVRAVGRTSVHHVAVRYRAARWSVRASWHPPFRRRQAVRKMQTGLRASHAVVARRSKTEEGRLF